VKRVNSVGRADVVSDLLRRVRIRSTVFCRSFMSAPWGFGVEAHGNPAFHLMTTGSGWLEVDGNVEQIPLAPGDLVVLPAGRRHWVRDAPTSPTPDLEEILSDTPLDEHRRMHYGGDGRRSTLVCGGFALEGGDAHPILSALPSVIHIRGMAGHPVPWVAATIDLLGVQARSDAPGAEVVVTRLADALLTQALGVALTELKSSDDGRVVAMRNPQIARAVELIHGQPERVWTVGELAAEVALSRSAFGSRFHELVGESPKRYMTRAG
jgi:AraC family transcriptional regulator, alkane utilization regulator